MIQCHLAREFRRRPHRPDTDERRDHGWAHSQQKSPVQGEKQPRRDLAVCSSERTRRKRLSPPYSGDHQIPELNTRVAQHALADD
jgi:hypothetical protein